MIKTPVGDIIRIKAKNSASITEVKQSIHAKDSSYKPDEFKLSFSGSSMDVQRESTIHIVRIHSVNCFDPCLASGFYFSTFKFFADSWTSGKFQPYHGQQCFCQFSD